MRQSTQIDHIKKKIGRKQYCEFQKFNLYAIIPYFVPEFYYIINAVY